MTTATMLNYRNGNHIPNMSTADVLAGEIRGMYIQYRKAFDNAPNYGDKAGSLRAWDTGENKGGKKNLPIWPELAREFRALSLDPSDYIPWRFEMQQAGKPVYPNTLLTPYYRQQWQAYFPKSQKQLRTAVLADLNLLVRDAGQLQRQGWSVADAYSYVLCRYKATVSLFVQHMVATEAGLASVAASTLHAARAAYSTRQADYNAVLGARVPQALK